MKSLIYAGLIATMVSTPCPLAPASNVNPINKPIISLSSTLFKDSIQIQTKEINLKNNLIESSLKFPKITELNNLQLQKSINTHIENDIINFRNKIVELSKEFNTTAKDQFKPFPYQAFTDYKVLYSKNDILSFYIDYYQYTGGAHGSTTRKCSNLDLKTGKTLTLKDILHKNTNYKNIINDEIKKEISKKPNMYFVSDFKGISDTQCFTINENNLVIYFQQYEIAPYASGIVEFKIPLTKLLGK